MFRRKRSSSNPPRPGGTTPNAAAALAASQAFLAKKQSDLSLSNSAAAAALRSYTPTPTPVGQVQTKRMQRKGSVSSSTGGSERPGLQRRGSGSSMTERTFREPSPAPMRPPERPASSHGPYPKRSTDTPPPVPALPIRYASPTPNNQRAGPRPASVNMNTRRMVYDDEVVLNRAVTPTARPPSAARSRQTGGGASDSAAAHLAANVANVNTNRNSVNYSRPMSPQNTPAAAARNLSTRTLSPEPQGPNIPGLSKLEADRIASGLQSIAEKPVKKKKKPAESNNPGGHLSAQHGQNMRQAQTIQADKEAVSAPSMSGPSLPSSIQAQTPSSDSQKGAVLPPAKKKKKKAVVEELDSSSVKRDEGFGNAYPSDTDSVASDVSSTTDRSRPTANRKKGLLAKQPSIVREDREAEEKAEDNTLVLKKTGLTKSPVSASQQSKASTASSSSSPKDNDKSKEKMIGAGTVSQSTQDRTLSPSRALHFLTQPTYGSPDGTKHQPLGRSASPAKSAMKHSPSRANSPSILKTQGFAGSDVSDVGSGISDDGSQVGKKKKRSVRVSFDSTPATVGQAASPISADSPVLMSPQNKSKRSSGLAQSYDVNPQSNQDHEDFAIKPTPTLPSFGSVRGKKEEQAIPGEPQKTGIGSSSDVTVPRVQNPQEAGVLPSVTSYQSSQAGQDSTIEHPEGKDSNADGGSHVPAIAVLPATPALDDMRAQDNEWLGMPGGFPGGPPGTSSAKTTVPSQSGSASSSQEPDVDASPVDDSQRSPNSGRSTPTATPASLGIAEPETELVAAQHDPSTPHVGELAESLNIQMESQKGEKGTEDDSVYSDAAEDQTDAEGDGFGSINAIVESPSNRPQDTASPPHSPLSLVDSSTDEQLKKIDSRELEKQRAIGYLRSLSPSQRAALDHAALPGAIEEPVVANRTLRGKNTIAGRPKKSSTKPLTQQGGDVIAASKTDYQRSQDAAPQANQKRPMSQPPLRTNLPSTQAQKSAPEPKGLLQKKGRPISAVPMVDYSNTQTSVSAEAVRPSAGSKRSEKATTGSIPAQQKQKAPRAKLGRTKSNDSDSDSSFKRARSAAPHSGKYQMKRSMRAAGPAGAQAPDTNRSKLGARAHDRSSSIASSSRPGGMRMSMRDSSTPSQPKRQSLRSPPDASKTERTKSPSRLSFALGSRSAKKDKSISTPKTTSVYSSRFGDSSDDEVGLPTLRSSRFDDSSDDEPLPLAPVRGIPRRTDEGDSTDLEDSSVENVKAPNSGKSNDTQPTTVSAPSTKPGSSALALGSMRNKSKGAQPTSPQSATGAIDQAVDKDKKKRSFFSMSRKRKDEPSRVRNSILGQSSPFDTPSKSGVNSPKPPESPSVVASPTTAARTSATNVVTLSPKAPRLQKRNTDRSPVRGSEGWPLQPPSQTKETSPDRPQTSDGNTSPTNPRPDLGSRRITLQTTPTAAAIAQAGATPTVEKKKRFQALRKAFGMKK